jgi:FADH2 O2-dependent halogenase
MSDMETTAGGSSPVHDVAILGSGIAGSMLAAVLARNGVKVLLLDASSHPRFAIGESTIPYTLVCLRTIAERYGVPEIKTLATFTNATKVLGPKFGVKKHFGFLLHHEGQDQDPKEVNQFGTPGLLHEASHLYRQDTDAYMYHVALKYGAVGRQNFRVADVDFDDAGVTLSTAEGEQYRARYVVDASGHRSPLAEKFDLREDPCRFSHHSRSIWNHMTRVRPTDELFSHRAPEDTPPSPWYQGTVHHMFERGWFWVIGFDNHPASRNPLCSVGLTLDERTYPKSADMTPEEEFYHHAARFPDIARQFEGARPVRSWTSTDRLQYSSRQCAGDRWFLLSHAAGFIDPLYSRGLSNTAEAINSLAWRLLDAVKDGDFSRERFDYVDRLQQGLFDYNDSLVNASFISFSDYDLWTAVYRIWSWGANAGTYRLSEGLFKYFKDGRDQHFKDLEKAPYPGLYWPDHEGFKALYDSLIEECLNYEAGKVTAREAADTVYAQLESANFVPKHFGFAERDLRFMIPNAKVMAKTARWLATEADPVVKRMMQGNAREAVKAKLKGRRIF